MQHSQQDYTDSGKKR